MTRWMMSIKAMALALIMVVSTSCGGNKPQGIPKLPGIEGPIMNVVNGKVLMTFKFLHLHADAGFMAPVPDTENSYMEFSPNAQDGGMMFVLHLDPKDLERIDVGLGDGNTLPDGRPLPGIPGGVLQNSLRLDTPWNDISFYYHEKMFGLWLPVGFETAGISGYWNMYVNNQNIGFLGLVGNDPVNGYSAGAVVLLNRDALKSSSLKSLIKKSERNPHIVY
ncbi:MAG TPA: hypothetical protein VKY27_02940 [Bacteriovoracaceae bacterium]|nr:hypothetical protein [Bacteriovoracaceae bacterium]